jgi:NTP pyrophosphatase (non-canonical NTP hydrolase)
MANRKMYDSAKALYDVGFERDRQEALRDAGKFPFSCATPNGLTEAEKLGVLAEEFGEIAQHVCKHMIPTPPIPADRDHKRMLECCNPPPITVDHTRLSAYRKHLREELIQVAAVCVAWVEALDVEEAT